MIKFNTILFDVDGVLIDSEKIYQSCWISAAKENGYFMSKEQALQLRSLDSTLAKELFLKWYGTKESYMNIRTSRKIVMQQFLSKNKLTLKTGAIETLKYLKENNFCLSVVTSSDFEKAEKYLNSVGIYDFFTKIISTKSVDKGKPYPDVYLYACQQLNISPKECFAIEDSPNGVKSAHTAGCRTVMIPDLTPYTDDLADYVDACYSDLKEFLKEEFLNKI